MLTHTGQMVLKDNLTAPTITDIAIHTGKIVRFGGAVSGFWTVLHHLFVCHDLGLQFAKAHNFSTPRTLYLLIDLLLHDAHEAITSDVPSTWKPSVMQDLQRDLDHRIYNSLGLRQSNLDAHVVKQIDALSLRAEAHTICPDHFKAAPHFAGDLTLEDRMVVSRIAEKYATPGDTIGANSPGVIKYIHILNEYISFKSDPMLLIDNEHLEPIGLYAIPTGIQG